MTVPMLTLNDGVKIPQLGYGVWQVEDDKATPSVLTALEVGYRHIDTAAIYGNEEGVGRAIAESGLRREDLFITTKLWNDSHRADAARKAIETSLEKLGLDYLDLYLVHWPAVIKNGGHLYQEAWDAMERFQDEGLVRSIGVCNFNPEHLDRLDGDAPSINQVELHPSLTQPDLMAAMQRRGITVEAWSPLGNQRDPRDLELPGVKDVAEATGRTPAQVILLWHIQSGRVVIPKSVTPSRIEENFNIFDFELDEHQMQTLDACNDDNRQGADPATATF